MSAWQHEEQKIECHFHEAKLLGPQQVCLLAPGKGHYVSTGNTRDQEQTKPKLSGLVKGPIYCLWQTVPAIKYPGDSVRQAENACAKPKRKQDCTMVTAEGAAGPGGTRLCLSAHVINACPHSKHLLKRCLSVSIYL